MRFLGDGQLFFKYDTPIFFIGYYPEIEESVLIINPCLKTIYFHHIYDATTAFAKIEQYLGHLACKGEPKIPTGDNKVIKDSKGFFDKSFKHR